MPSDEIPTSDATTLAQQFNSFRYINRIDRALKVVASLHPATNPGGPIELRTKIYYHGDYIAILNFFLHDYSVAEAMEVAQNIRNNEYILQAIDQYLAGDVVE